MSADLQSVGTAVYLGPSVLDHSCQPNAVATFEGTRLCIRLVNIFFFRFVFFGNGVEEITRCRPRTWTTWTWTGCASATSTR